MGVGGKPLDAMQNGGIQFDATGIETLDKGIIKKWRENPSLMLYKLQANGYKFSWLADPASIPFLWLCCVATAIQGL